AFLAKATPARATAKTFEALESRLALGVDLTTVKSLALVGVADNLIGGIELGKTRGSLGVLVVGVGVQLLGKLAERTLDLSGARLPPHAEHLIGVAHLTTPPISLPRA